MAFEQPERARAKTRITIRIDGEVLDWFRGQVKGGAGNYQTLINDALRDHVTRREGTLAETLRRVVREELARKKRRRRPKPKPRKASRKKRASARPRPRARKSALRKRSRKASRKRHK